jgi:hypothetical protein
MKPPVSKEASEARGAECVQGAPKLDRTSAGALGRVVAWLILLKAGYFVILCGILWLWPDLEQTTLSNVKQEWFERFGAVPPPAESQPFARHFATWDAEHYLYLSQAGYLRPAPSRAFYT